MNHWFILFKYFYVLSSGIKTKQIKKGVKNEQKGNKTRQKISGAC